MYYFRVGLGWVEELSSGSKVVLSSFVRCEYVLKLDSTHFAQQLRHRNVNDIRVGHVVLRIFERLDMTLCERCTEGSSPAKASLL